VSGRTLIRRVLKCANDSSNEGLAFTLHLWLRGGREIHGAVMDFDTQWETLVLQVWERKLYNGFPRAGELPVQTERIVQIDADAIVMAEIHW
jgi:hypothetical protein